MPGYTCSIKERMLYSSCKNHLVDWVEGELKLPIDKKVKTSRNLRSRVTWSRAWAILERIPMNFLSFLGINELSS